MSKERLFLLWGAAFCIKHRDAEAQRKYKRDKYKNSVSWCLRVYVKI